jgi:hypothetical protein
MSAIRSVDSASEGDSGFSHRTGLPAATQARTKPGWVASCEATRTASTSASAITAAGSSVARQPSRPATEAARGRSRSAITSSRAPATDRRTIVAWSVPMTPAPMMPMRTMTLNLAAPGPAAQSADRDWPATVVA